MAATRKPARASSALAVSARVALPSTIGTMALAGSGSPSAAAKLRACASGRATSAVSFAMMSSALLAAATVPVASSF